MAGPGRYVGDVTEGITRVEDLPQPKVSQRRRNYRRRRCPACGRSAYRLRTVVRRLHDLGDPVCGRPRDIQITYSQHHCPGCGAYFNAEMDDLASPKSHYTHRVVFAAVRLVVEDGLPYRSASWHLWREHRVFVPFATIQNWVEAGGEKGAAAYVADEYLDQALAGFSGYIAADELYDGPFCVLSVVDNHTFKRLVYEVLDHDPSHEDTRRFFRRFQAILQARGLTLAGITTDGSPLYPVPIAEVFGPIPHQICEFHTIAELTKAVLRAVAKVRKSLAARLPKLPRGRPSKAGRKVIRRVKRMQQRIKDLFDHRHVFVQHGLTPGETRILQRISRGLPQLRTLREIMNEVYRLFDRRCRADTAVAKLTRLRTRVRRFKAVGRTLQKLFSPNLEKALVFLDDSLLPSTSNAVERGNRRHRKMQKSVYRVRGQEHIVQRIALDMQREAQRTGRDQATATLHLARTG